MVDEASGGESRADEIRRRVLEGDVLVVHQLHDQFEQAEVQQVLDSEEIPYEIRLSYETAFSFLFAPQKGFGVVMTRADDAARAQALIGALLASEPSIEEIFPGLGQDSDEAGE